MFKVFVSICAHWENEQLFLEFFSKILLDRCTKIFGKLFSWLFICIMRVEGHGPKSLAIQIDCIVVNWWKRLCRSVIIIKKIILLQVQNKSIKKSISGKNDNVFICVKYERINTKIHQNIDTIIMIILKF